MAGVVPIILRRTPRQGIHLTEEEARSDRLRGFAQHMLAPDCRHRSDPSCAPPLKAHLWAGPPTELSRSLYCCMLVLKQVSSGPVLSAVGAAGVGAMPTGHCRQQARLLCLQCQQDLLCPSEPFCPRRGLATQFQGAHPVLLPYAVAECLPAGACWHLASRE